MTQQKEEALVNTHSLSVKTSGWLCPQDGAKSCIFVLVKIETQMIHDNSVVDQIKMIWPPT